jgi:glutamine amidotransferase
VLWHSRSLTDGATLENWVNVPTNSILTIHRQTVMVHPILDKYYERDPHHIRSSAFVQAKGLVSNEKAPGGQSPGNDGHHGGLNGFRKMMAQSVASRSLSPDLSRRSATPVPVKDSYFSPSPSHAPLASRPLPGQGNIKVRHNQRRC